MPEGQLSGLLKSLINMHKTLKKRSFCTFTPPLDFVINSHLSVRGCGIIFFIEFVHRCCPVIHAETMYIWTIQDPVSCVCQTAILMLIVANPKKCIIKFGTWTLRLQMIGWHSVGKVGSSAICTRGKSSRSSCKKLVETAYWTYITREWNNDLIIPRGLRSSFLTFSAILLSVHKQLLAR